MLRIIQGDALEQLRTLWTGSVQCCVCSPPYWGLRDYGTAQWKGGEGECDHRKLTEEIRIKSESTCTLNAPSKANSHAQEGWKSVCGRCGARRVDSQLGLESTPEEYIAKIVAVFREVWRVLRDDGTLWLNMGDSYAGASSYSTPRINQDQEWAWGKNATPTLRGDRNGMGKVPGLKSKDLCMMPARLAMALQTDGWYLRSDIIWHKPNPMPESVTDRPTKAHEYIFLLTKAERYFYDAEAIREPVSETNGAQAWRRIFDSSKQCKEAALKASGFKNGNDGSRDPDATGRNKRSVWTIATQPYAEAHFATFPEEIPKLCILAGSKPGDAILDPFAGSGTVGKVALELGRRAVLIELNPAYIELMRDRTFVTPGFL